MTAFLTPDGEPFYAGHVLPAGAAPRDAGVPAGARPAIAEAWRERRDEVEPQGAQIAERDRAARRRWRRRGAARPTRSPRAALERCAERSTRSWGGFGGAPKFPQPMTLEFVLRLRAARRARRAARW